MKKELIQIFKDSKEWMDAIDLLLKEDTVMNRALDRIEKLEAQNKVMREALEYVRDSVFVSESYVEIIEKLEMVAKEALAIQELTSS